MSFDLATAYEAAFTRVYPQKRCVVKRKFSRQGKLLGFNVCIDGEDVSHRLLSTEEMHEAIAGFNR